MTNSDAIRILSVLHLGYSEQVKEACEMAIKALMNIDEQGDVTVKSNPKSEYPVTYILTFHKQ